MSDVRRWLAGIGLGQYADAFETNDVEMDLPNGVDDQMLKDIGVTSAGHRLRIRSAIAKLADASDIEVNSNIAVVAPDVAAASGERRQRVEVSGRPSSRHHLYVTERKAGQRRRA